MLLRYIQSVHRASPLKDCVITSYSIHYTKLYEPICADGVKPIAGIILNVPKYRWSEEKLLQEWLPELRAMAARISYRLGALQYTPYHQSQQASIQPTP